MPISAMFTYVQRITMLKRMKQYTERVVAMQRAKNIYNKLWMWDVEAVS